MASCSYFKRVGKELVSLERFGFFYPFSNQYLEGRNEVDGDADIGNGESLADQVGSIQQQLVEVLQLGEQLFSENQHFSSGPFFF